MVRRLPSSPESNPSIHPALVISFLAACVAATIAIFALLCASRHRKPSWPKPKSPSRSPSPSTFSYKSPENTDTLVAAEESILTFKTPPQSPPMTIKVQEQQDPSSIEEKKEKVLDARPTSRRRLSMNLSMKLLPEGLAKIRTSRKERQEKPGEESVWMKTIILGERCRVPSDDEEEVVVCDEKGNRQRNYHPRTPRSVPVSRTNSFVGIDMQVM